MTANAYVRLAAELRDCMTFEPTKWKRVMAQSTRVLDGGKRDAAANGRPQNLHTVPYSDTRRRVAVGRDARVQRNPAGDDPRKRLRSREEADAEDAMTAALDDPRRVALPSIHQLKRNGAVKRSMVAIATPTPTLAQYLNQPHLVDEILHELADAQRNDDAVEDAFSLQDDAVGAEDICETQPDSESVFVDTTPRVASRTRAAGVLPVLSIVSPRTRDGLARLPALTKDELGAIDEIERLADASARRESMYKALRKVGDERPPPSRGFRHRKMATTVSPERPRDSVGGVTPPPTKPPWKKRAALSEQAKQRAEMIHMALNDVNAQHLQIAPRARFAVHHAKIPILNGLPRDVRDKLQRDHAQLLDMQMTTEVHTHVADARLTQTLEDIRQWIPLDVLYAFGLGTFASPAQQRAADLLFRVGQRLRFNLVLQALAQWKRMVQSEKMRMMTRSTLILQCWWRQVLALREVARRRRLRREIERRQRALLLLLASHENKSACTITRAIRRYGLVRKCGEAGQRDHAATRIQRFWRHQQAAWLALRHRIRQERRHKAAVVLQCRARGVLARRRRRLLERINQVERKIAQRENDRIERSKARYRVGAVLVIQRTFRAWVQRRVLALRHRRAQFERDKGKILRLQAYFRGRRARRWITNHRKKVDNAIVVIQCAWRCHIARKSRMHVERQRQVQRAAEAAAFAERQRARNARVIALPVNLNNAAWGGLAAKVTSPAKKDGGLRPRQIAAATRLQALWRGARSRRRLKHQHAREKELSRRHVNRRRKEAAVCIQRHVRGMQGRARAWHIMVHRSASRIQVAWRGFMTRRELFRMRAALKAIMKMQCRWRVRRKNELQARHHGAARRIQRAWRRWMGKTWLFKAVRRQQFLAEEHAMGIALIKLTRKRVGDELLVQSFTHRDVKILASDNVGEDDEEIHSVERSLYKLDSTKKIWTRRGYDGIWQELYRDISGHSFDIDNSHFARFLKAMPREFINQRQFPIQTVDLIFAKMKEPKARTIPFPRFNKAMAMVWHDKFTPPPSKQTTTSNEGQPDASAVAAAKKQLEQDHFLKFMLEFVLPSTLQNGKYRKLLEDSATKRLEWAANVLRRFANRIIGKQRHHQFIIVYREHNLEQTRANAARVLQRHYRVYKFRATLKATLAQMFIEYIDYKGRSVRLEHIETKKTIPVVNNRRPAFLRGVQCHRRMPLPFPGEEFHAFCGRHESATDPHRKVPATLYCVECEDPMCAVCFARDHDKRAAFQTHAPCAITTCSHCHVETATRECLQCGDGHVPFCDVCFPFVHHESLPQNSNDTAAVKQSQHRSRRLVVACVECEERVAQWRCDTCEDVFCKRCLSKCHAKGQRQSHACHRLSYFSVLQQKAESKRRADAQKVHDQKRREREARRAEEERVRKLREASATTIQALVRSYHARQHGKAYMKLVRQTHAAKAQRLKDERKRSSLGYKIKSVFGLQPTLRSDTQDETAARRRRIESIKRTLFFYRYDDEDDGGDEADTPAGKPGKTVKKRKKKKKRWTKKARAAVEKAATTWLVYGMQVKIVRSSSEWKDAVGSILSTQNLFTTGHVLVFIPLANRAVVINWEELTPYDEDEILRQAYVPPSQVATDAARNLRGKVSRFTEATARRAKLLYLQSIEFHDIVQYAWVVEYNKHEQKEEYWNVVLNKRTFSVPKAIMLLERMEGDERDRVDARVALAKKKLVQLLHPFQPLDKPRLVFRRHAVVALPASLKSIEGDVYTRLCTEAEALKCARFWQAVVVADTQFGGKHAQRFLMACCVAPRSSLDCWHMATLLQWIELQDTDTFTEDAKSFFKKTQEIQMYIVNELAHSIEKKELKEAQAKLERLLKLKDETIQLLISKADQEAAAAEDKEKTGRTS